MRPAILTAAAVPFASPEPNGPLRLLVVGGSQGARVMSDIVPGAIEKLEPMLWSRLILTQQVRKEDMGRVRAIYDRLKINAELAPFFTDLPARLASSHLVISRSGAGTVAELAAIGRPSILVPLPGAIDQDQFANAGVLAQVDGALRIPQAEFTPDRLAAEISALAAEPARLTAMAASRPQGRPARRRRTAGRSGDESGRNLGRYAQNCPCHASRKRGIQYPAAPDLSLGFAEYWIVRCLCDNAHEADDDEQTRRTMRLPREIGPIHFVGIGGIGMSGIAEVLCNLGYTVQGSDASESGNVARLREKGIKVSVGHKAENVDGADVVVVSTAIKRDNPELMAARAQRIPVVRRAEMLAELMRLKSCVAIAGTHGKTTTTSMVAALLDAGDLDPTVINGGIINAYGTNARLGAGDWMVVEADESDGTFLKLPTDVAIVTNVDPEHLDHFKTFEAVQDAFRNFVENVPFYGFAVMCIDHPVVQTLVGKIEDRRIITYGENPQADARLVDLTPTGGGSKFKVVFRNRKTDATHEISDIMLPMPGRHNASNATAAIAVAHELGISDEAIRKAIAGFGGVKRRFTRTGEWNGVTVIDDYGHHPVEIAAVLKAARESTNGKIVAVVQPHRFTRLQSLFEEFCTCFNDADAVVVAEVYPAGEAPIEGIDRDHFVLGLRAHGHREVIPLPSSAELAKVVHGIAQPGDLVVCLGAGNITQWAYALPGELKALG